LLNELRINLSSLRSVGKTNKHKNKEEEKKKRNNKIVNRIAGTIKYEEKIGRELRVFVII
jgi:hypothetical protein